MKPAFLAHLVLIAALTACLPVQSRRPISAKPTATPIIQAATGSGPVLTITRAEILKNGTESELHVSFAPPDSGANALMPRDQIHQFCASTTACQCRFSWQEINTTVPGQSVQDPNESLAYQRTAYTDTRVIQREGLVVCKLPSVFEGEVGLNDVVSVTILPALSSTPAFTTTARTFQKPRPSETVAASFEDLRGNRLRDIRRYVCHEKLERGASISSLALDREFTPPKMESVTYSKLARVSFGSRFCITGFSGNANIGDCASSPKVTASQLNYFSLYAPANNQLINSGNLTYSCPLVSPTLRASGVATSRDFFPLDSQFALAQSSSKEFPVPVEARSRLGLKNSVDSSRHYLCRGSSEAAVDDTGIVIGCLGYAARPAANGTCPSITVSGSTTLRPMYRLRRFNALYPPMYDTNGEWIDKYQNKIDQIYVLDRPATFDGGVPGTIRGPKPCPFAWYDRTGATGSVGYKSTNNSAWTGVNPEGLRLPYLENYGSCPAVLPQNQSAAGAAPVIKMKMLTSSADEDGFIRPIRKAWEPTYWEDLTFQACAPMANEYVTAPVHQRVSAAGAPSYCEEIYPSRHRETPEAVSHAGQHRSIDFSEESKVQHFPVQAPLGGIQTALQNLENHGCTASASTDTSIIGKSYPRSGGCCKDTNASGHVSSCQAPQ